MRKAWVYIHADMKKKIHYCWLILFSCCMLQGAGLGVVSNCAGLFYAPIAAELGFSIGSISLYSSISVVTSCVVMLFAARLMEKFGDRVVLTLGAVCTSAPMLIMSFCRALWQWYVLAVFQGAGLAFTMNLIAPIILNNWFRRRLGLALGLSVSSGGIVGAIMSTVVGAIIRSGGWRNAYRIGGIVGLVMTVPVCLFILHMHPQDIGLEPYGGEGEGRARAPEKKHGGGIGALLRDVRLWKLIPVIALGRISTAFMVHITTYGNTVGFAIMDASILTTLFMIGNMLSKIGFGPLNDRWGAKRCCYLGLGIILAAEVLLLGVKDETIMLGALLFGAVSMFSQVQIPILCRCSWDGADYARVMVAVQVCSQLFYSAGISGIGFAYDFLGDYRPVIALLIAFVFLSAFFVGLIFRKGAHIK